MTAQELEVEIKKLDQRFSIVDNPNNIGISNIFFTGMNYDLPPVSTFDIRDVPDRSHMYTFPNGHLGRFYAKPEVMARIEDFLKKIKGGALNDYHAEE